MANISAQWLSHEEQRCLAALNAELQVIRNIRREPLSDENLLLTLAAGARAQKALDELNAWRETAAILAVSATRSRHA